MHSSPREPQRSPRSSPKIGVEGVPSTLAAAIRTLVVLVMAWAMVFGLNQHTALSTLTPVARLSGVVGSGNRRIVAGVLPAPADGTGLLGRAHRQLSLPFAIILAFVVLREPLTWQTTMGVTLMVCGALLCRA